MIFRSSLEAFSVLGSTVAGGIGSGFLGLSVLAGGKDKVEEYMHRASEKLQQQERVMMASEILTKSEQQKTTEVRVQ